MIKEIVDSLKDNPIIAASVAIGGIAGTVGGAVLSSNGAVATLAAIALGAVGTVSGLLIGSYINQRVDESKPAPPSGMRQVNATPIEPGKAATVSFRPTNAIASTAVSEIKQHMPEVAKLLPPNMEMLAPLSKIDYSGDVKSDGKTLSVNRLDIGIPGVSIPSIAIAPIEFTLKDGAIDQANPDNISKFNMVGKAIINTRVPASQRQQALQILDKVLADPSATAALAASLQRSENNPALGGNAHLPDKRPGIAANR